MNINTATILNLISPKTNPAIKEKIESLSVNGKINLENISKDKGIQTLLSGLFKDIATGVQSKENIASLLQNNKQNFSFKNLSEDIKTLIKFIQTDSVTNSKLETQLVSLKSSLIDIKNIDEKMIKSNVSNSGVFLESKLAQQVIPVSKNIEQLLALIKGQLDISSTQLIKSDIPKDLKVEIKSAIENILKDIKTLKVESNPQNQSTLLTKIDSQIKVIQQNLLQNGQNTLKIETPKIENLNTLSSQLKDQLAILNGTLNTNVIQQQLTQIQANTTMTPDLKLEIKNAVESLLRDIKNIKAEQNPVKQMQNLATLETKILTTQHNINSPIMKNEITPNIKDLFLNLKEQILSKNFVEIKNGFMLVEEKITNVADQIAGAKNIKSDISNTLEQLRSFNVAKTPQQQQLVLQNIFNNTQAIQTKVDTLPQALFENNLSKTTNFMNDLKITASIIEEYTKNSNEPISKELKTIIDKINTQIDFYQLLSYSTNSTHTYLSFLQDEIEDSDIRFNKNNDESFSCQINLSLKKYGDLKILMILDNKSNININIGLEQEEFKSLVQENLQKLRVGINSIDLLLQSLNIFSLNSSEQKSIRNSYGSSTDLSFGLDIKA
ncbi:MAG: hypothetical protein K8R39_04325 [Arcobacteraceae bacterium]|nr:hypothetical protein [Arcobacteraceae bacterium]